MQIKTEYITNYNASEWTDYNFNFAMSSAVRYIIIKISPEYARHMYIDNVSLDEPKPLISKITDSIGRTVDFSYSGNPDVSGSIGTVSLLITAPDGNTKTLIYNKEAIEFETKYQDHQEQRLLWYLNSSLTEAENTGLVRYFYDGDINNGEHEILYSNYLSKTHSVNDSRYHKPVLGGVRYKNRQCIYKYETVRKNLGDDGYYDTLRISERYEQY